jgi:NAD-dependent DNA ligase
MRELGVSVTSTVDPAVAGRSVCFTGSLGASIGGERISRAMATHLASAAGLQVRDEVTPDLDLLVVADPRTQSLKARFAREHGIRIVAEMELWRLLGLRPE